MMGHSAVQLVATFDCSAMETPLQDAIAQSGVASAVRITPPGEVNAYMWAPSADSEDTVGTIVVVRLEDWLRSFVTSLSLEVSEASARLELRRHIDEFLSLLAVMTMRGRPVWVLVCPSNGWVSEHYRLATLCRTMSNLFVVRMRNLAQVSMLAWPSALSSDDKSLDREADRTTHVPYDVSAYGQLGESIANQVASQIAASSSRDNGAVTSGSAELAAFLSRLSVNVKVNPASASDRGDIDRIVRTAASFSLAGENPTASDADIDHVLSSEHCYVVNVSDRFSNHGVTGVIAGRSTADSLIIEVMSLSCTVLGKQVEHALLSALAQLATAQHINKVVFEYRPSSRNQPTHAFLKSVANESTNHQFVLPVEETGSRIQEAAIAPNEWTVKILIR